MLQSVTPAPTFTLPDQNGEPRSLADYRGQKVILYFYSKDMTAGCTSQSCSMLSQPDGGRYAYTCFFMKCL